MSATVVYEVNLGYSGQDVAGFDQWLEAHVEQMLEFDGFAGATISTPAADSGQQDGAARRTVQYRLDSAASLETYLEKHAARMRAEGIARFGDALAASRRVLTSSTEKAAPALARQTPRCRNCAEPLNGQYCANCGQRDKHRMISLLELFADFIGDLFELDSRIWRSLRPLVFRPGVLTLEYLSGRRVRYTPPLRMYLVLSVLLFAVATVGNDITIEDGGADLSPEERQQAATEAVEALKELKAPQALIDDIEAEISQPDETDDDVEFDGGGFIDDDCNVAEFPPELNWLNRPAVIDRIERACTRLKTADGRQAFAGDLLGNVPTMMFIFLPVLAFIMKLLYVGSRRYYVEHLLFFVHYHSYFYLAAAITIGFNRLPEDLFPGQGTVTGLLVAALVIYTPYYLFRSMRVVYGQHWLITFIKFIVLKVAYFFGLMLTFAMTALVTALLV